MTLTLRFDGLYMSIPKKGGKFSSAGFMCYGWIISRDGRVLARGHGGYVQAHNASSHIAEYLGLIEGLEALHDMGATGETILVIGDAKSLIDQMRGKAAVNSDHIRPLNRRACQAARGFDELIWEWLPRRNNRAADALTRRALRQIRANPASYMSNLYAKAKPKTSQFRPVLDLRIYQPD